MTMECLCCHAVQRATHGGGMVGRRLRVLLHLMHAAPRRAVALGPSWVLVAVAEGVQRPGHATSAT